MRTHAAPDFQQVRRDSVLVDALAGRRLLAADDEPVVTMLAAWAGEIDDDRAWTRRSTATALPPRSAAGQRLATVALTVGAALALSAGAAAAVTGDPLAPVKGVGQALGVTVGHPAAEERSVVAAPEVPDLPDQASDVAQVQHLIVHASAAVAHGDLGTASDQLARAQALLDGLGDAPAGLQHRLDALAASIDRVGTRPVGAGADHQHDPGRGVDNDHGRDDHGRDAPGGPAEQGDRRDGAGDAGTAGQANRSAAAGAAGQTKAH